MGKKSKRRTKNPSRAAAAAPLPMLPQLSPENLDFLQKTDYSDDADIHEKREKADLVRDKLNEFNGDKWDSFRFAIFMRYIKLLADLLNLIRPTDAVIIKKEDRKFLKKISLDAEESSVFRAQAAETKAHIYYLVDIKHDDYFAWLRMAHEIAESASDQERILNIDSPDGTRYTQIGERLDGIKEKIKERLRNAYNVDVAGNSSRYKFQGGENCDYPGCGKTLYELDSDKLEWQPLVCGGCQLSHYCSKECQKADWKLHRKTCREKGEFRAGDMALAAIVAESGYMTSIIYLLAPGAIDKVKGEPHSWLVSNLGGQDVFALPTKDLRRLRSTLWRDSFNGRLRKHDDLTRLLFDKEPSVLEYIRNASTEDVNAMVIGQEDQNEGDGVWSEAVVRARSRYAEEETTEEEELEANTERVLTGFLKYLEV